MESLISFVVVALVTLLFVHRYVKRLAVAKQGSPGETAAGQGPAAPSEPCPRCARPVARGSQFCPACGAPLALWTVHRASVQAAGNGAGPSGRPTPVINTTMCIGCGSCVDVCPETGTLALAGGKAILANPERCTGHSKCVDACPTQAIGLSRGGVLQTVRVPLVRENFETNVTGLYIVGELGGMGLIKTAINEGRLVADYIARQFREQAPGPGSGPVCDVVVVGAGPAGLSASLAAHQHGLNYVTLEQGEIASTIRHYPRHKFLMAEPIEMPLYGSLYIADTTKESLLSVWESIIANTGVRVQTNTRVDGVRRSNGCFEVMSTRGVFLARTVVLASGKRGSPRRLGVTGEDLDKVAYRLIEADTYDDKDIIVVGGGDSAIEAALAVAKAGKNRVTLSYRSERFDRARGRNQQHLQEAESQERIRVLRNSHVREIKAHSAVLETDGKCEELRNDFLFVLIGGESPDAFLQRLGVEIVEKSIGAPAPAFVA